MALFGHSYNQVKNKKIDNQNIIGNLHKHEDTMLNELFCKTFKIVIVLILIVFGYF